MFKSDAHVLYAPPVISDKSGGVLVIGPDGLDISGGDALKAERKNQGQIPY